MHIERVVKGELKLEKLCDPGPSRRQVFLIKTILLSGDHLPEIKLIKEIKSVIISPQFQETKTDSKNLLGS